MKIFKIFFLIFFIPVLSVNRDKWIVVTTIQSPTPMLKKLASLDGWQLLVVGDKKTPADWYLDEKCIYLSPEDQENLPFKLAKLLPWNHYARKNIGYLYAIAHGAKVIYDTDDDNYVMRDIQSFKERKDIVVLRSSSPVINIYAYYGQPTLWPRGFPLSCVTKSDFEILPLTSLPRIAIEQGLVDGEPDVDAIFRLTRKDNTNIFFNKERSPCILEKGTFCPFNTQNTLFYPEAFWGLYIPTHVAFRVCDIWRGYITQRLLWKTGMSVCFTSSTAIQERNAHDLMKDFRDEQDLYLKTESFISFLQSWESLISYHDILEDFKNIYYKAMEYSFLGQEEKLLINAWIEDMRDIASSCQNNVLTENSLFNE